MHTQKKWCACVHVLVGTDDLLGLMNLSAHLSRRSVEIHFSRYQLEQTEDLKEFRKLLRTFQRHVPLAKEPDLESHDAYFYERSLGCTGMLKTLWNKALGAALEQGERTLLPKRWERHAEPPQKLKEMLLEIRQGEQQLHAREDEAHMQDLRTPWGVSSLSPKRTLPPVDPALSPASPADQPASKRERRVGPRHAERDSIGKEAKSAG